MKERSRTHDSKLLLRGLAVLAIGIIVGCQSTMQVQHQNAFDARATSYVSYEIIQHPVGRTGSVDEIIEQGIHQGMTAKGYERTATANADLLVSYKVLLDGDASALYVSDGPPDDGLNGDAKYSGLQPVWDVVAYDDLRGPQLAEKRGAWPSPGPSPVFDTIPAIDVSAISKQSQSKILLVMLQEPATMRVVWLGWSTSDVSPGALAATTRSAIGEIVSRLPGAASRSVAN